MAYNFLLLEILLRREQITTIAITFFNYRTQAVVIKSNWGGDLQDGGRVRRGDHLPPHKYIRNTSTFGTTLTEHLLNAGRRPQTSQKARNSPRTWVGQKKKNRDKRIGTGLALLGGSFHTLGRPFTGGGGVWSVGEASEPWRTVQQQGCRGQRGEIPAQRINADQHSLGQEACLLTHQDGWGLGAKALASEFRSQGEDWGWLCEHSLKGASVPQLAGGSLGKSLELPKRQETIVLGCVRRGDSEHCLN